jgi:hypothetical protein
MLGKGLLMRRKVETIGPEAQVRTRTGFLCIYSPAVVMILKIPPWVSD